MQTDDTRSLCRCGCGLIVKTGNRFLTGSHLTSRFTDEERFWLNFDCPLGGDCWPWAGAVGGQGYGRFMVNGSRIRAHKYSWALHVGPVPDGLEVCHRCDNRLCCNPAHLWLGTHHENMLDAAAKDRMGHGGPKTPRRGEQLSKAKLRETDIPMIRALHREGMSARQIGMRYGVADKQIHRIIKGTGWTHVK